MSNMSRTLIKNIFLIVGILIIGSCWAPSGTKSAQANVSWIRCTGEDVVWLKGGYGIVGPLVSAEDAVAPGRTVSVKLWFNGPVYAKITLHVLNKTFEKTVKPDVSGRSETVFYFKLPKNVSLKEIPFTAYAYVYGLQCGYKELKTTLLLNTSGTFEILDCTVSEDRKWKKEMLVLEEKLKIIREFVIKNSNNIFLKPVVLKLAKDYEQIRSYMFISKEYKEVRRKCGPSLVYLKKARTLVDSDIELIEKANLFLRFGLISFLVVLVGGLFL